MNKSITVLSIKKKLALLLLVSAMTVSLTACGGSEKKSTEDISKVTSAAEKTSGVKSENEMTLTEALNKRKEKSAETIPEDKRKIMSSALDVLKESGIEDKVLKSGQKVPQFDLPDATGKKVVLAEELKNGPAVIVFYRGGWCPYCNLNLHYLQKNLEKIKEQGASLIAVSPETPDSTMTTKEKNELEFYVLSDQGNKVADKFGLVFTLPDDLHDLYKEFGIDLEKSNGDDSHKLPLSATFIVDKDGVVIERFVDVDYKKRMSPDDIISVLKKHKEATGKESIEKQ